MTHERDIPKYLPREQRMGQFLYIVSVLQPWATTGRIARRAGMVRSWHVKGMLLELVEMGYLDVETGKTSNGWTAYYWSLTQWGEDYIREGWKSDV